MTRVCSRNLTQRPAFGGDDNAFPTCGLRINVRRFWWVTLSEHKWVILGERRGAEVGHEGPVLVLAGLEQLVPLGLLCLPLLARFLIAQGHEPVFLLPPVRLKTKFTLPPGIRLLRRLPLGLAQLLD